MDDGGTANLPLWLTPLILFYIGHPELQRWNDRAKRVSANKKMTVQSCGLW
jgi:hypothetical protein